jgi:hypothetical protein
VNNSIEHFQSCSKIVSFPSTNYKTKEKAKYVRHCPNLSHLTFNFFTFIYFNSICFFFKSSRTLKINSQDIIERRRRYDYRHAVSTSINTFFSSIYFSIVRYSRSPFRVFHRIESYPFSTQRKFVQLTVFKRVLSV